MLTSHFIQYYAECHYTECHQAECRYADCSGSLGLCLQLKPVAYICVLYLGRHITTLNTNMKLGQKGLSGTNDLVYFCCHSPTKVGVLTFSFIFIRYRSITYFGRHSSLLRPSVIYAYKMFYKIGPLTQRNVLVFLRLVEILKTFFALPLTK